MTKAWVLSDLHIDHNVGLDLGPHPECDLILMAGDLADGDVDVVPWLLHTFTDDERAKLIYVPGNHDAYGIGLAALDRSMARLALETGITTLLDQTVVVDGHRIVGTPLWSPFSPDLDAAYGHKGDFRHIPDLTPDRWRKQHACHREWLDDTLRAGDILVTHHAVAWEGLATDMQHAPARALFASGYNGDVEDILFSRQPGLVVHGHTHIRRCYEVGPIPVVSNALGREWGLSTHFVTDLVIDLPPPRSITSHHLGT